MTSLGCSPDVTQCWNLNGINLPRRIATVIRRRCANLNLGVGVWQRASHSPGQQYQDRFVSNPRVPSRSGESAYEWPIPVLGRGKPQQRPVNRQPRPEPRKRFALGTRSRPGFRHIDINTLNACVGCESFDEHPEAGLSNPLRTYFESAGGISSQRF